MGLKASYGKVKADFSTKLASRGLITSEISTQPVNDLNTYSESDTKYKYFSAYLYPELSYYFSKHLGLSLGLGGIEYALTDWKTDNSIIAVNFNPSYWKLGFKVAI